MYHGEYKSWRLRMVCHGEYIVIASTHGVMLSIRVMASTHGMSWRIYESWGLCMVCHGSSKHGGLGTGNGVMCK